VSRVALKGEQVAGWQAQGEAIDALSAGRVGGGVFVALKITVLSPVIHDDCKSIFPKYCVDLLLRD